MPERPSNTPDCQQLGQSMDMQSHTPTSTTGDAASSTAPAVIVAGHICLDIIPTFAGDQTTRLDQLLQPGRLVNIGPAVTSTGGAVSNTGLALHRLGVATSLMGKVGDDLFGHAILDLLRRRDPALAAGMIVDGDAVSSYTLVINPPGEDRAFLHCPGANDTFSASDVTENQLRGAQIVHFGYPPIMRSFFLDDGAQLVALMQRIRQAGAVSSLDMAYPDREAEAGRADWRTILARVLPHVDIFLPSLEEMLFMLDRDRHDAMLADGGIPARTDGALLADLAQEMLAMGAAMAGLKLGDQGFYLRTTEDAARLAALPLRRRLDPAQWAGRELLAPCFQVDVAGTTGAGDCTIAGFLAALLHGLPADETLRHAVAVGACNVEQADATSGIRPWAEVRARMAAGWMQRPLTLTLNGWRLHEDGHLRVGPHDRHE